MDTNNPKPEETTAKPNSEIIQVGNVKSINWLKVIILVILLFVFGSLAFYAGHKFPVRVADNNNSSLY